jgi:hypothetical protein
VAFHASGVIEVGDQLAGVRQTEAQLSRQLPHRDRSRVQQPSQHGTVSVTQPSGIEDRTQARRHVGVRALEMVGQQRDQRLKLKLFLSGHRGTWTRHCRGLGASSCQLIGPPSNRRD